MKEPHRKQSEKCEHVWWYAKGSEVEDLELDEGWYWYDETGLLGTHTPYLTEDKAIAALNKYANDFLSSM